MDAMTIFLFVLNNVIWMFFTGWIFYIMLPEAKRKGIKMPVVKIKNPLAKKPAPPSEYNEVDTVDDAGLDAMAKSLGMKRMDRPQPNGQAK